MIFHVKKCIIWFLLNGQSLRVGATWIFRIWNPQNTPSLGSVKIMFIVGVRIIKQWFQFLYYTFKGIIYSVYWKFWCIITLVWIAHKVKKLVMIKKYVNISLEVLIFFYFTELFLKVFKLKYDFYNVTFEFFSSSIKNKTKAATSENKYSTNTSYN